MVDKFYLNWIEMDAELEEIKRKQDDAITNLTAANIQLLIDQFSKGLILATPTVDDINNSRGVISPNMPSVEKNDKKGTIILKRLLGKVKTETPNVLTGVKFAGAIENAKSRGYIDMEALLQEFAPKKISALSSYFSLPAKGGRRKTHRRRKAGKSRKVRRNKKVHRRSQRRS